MGECVTGDEVEASLLSEALILWCLLAVWAPLTLVISLWSLFCSAHSRNESTDSGLSVSSLPRTSDHMLSSVDHMDTGNWLLWAMAKTALRRIQVFVKSVPFSSLVPSGESGDASSMTLQESMPVLPMSEGEELIPCIPEGLGSDLLMDMETVLSGSHMDRDSLLTWL